MTGESTLMSALPVPVAARGRQASASGWGMLVGVLSAVLLAATLTAWAGQRLREREMAARARPAPLREWPERPLPREWRWRGRSYDFGRMFRSSQR